MAVVERCRDEKTTFEACIKTFKSDGAHFTLFKMRRHVQCLNFVLFFNVGEGKLIL
jgi:hypothetical protein